MIETRKPTTPADGSARVHSASGIALALRCRRAWALRYLDGHKPAEIPWAVIAKAEAAIKRARAAGLRPPEHPCEYGGQRGAALGKEVHARAETYLTAGADGIDWNDLPGQILQTLVDLLPPAGSVPRSAVEHEFEVRLASVMWRGLIDVYDPTGEHTSFAGIQDHKTSKSIAEYCLLPHEVALEFGLPKRSLLDDLQSCIYTLYTCSAAGVGEVACRWNYAETGPTRRSLPVIQPIGYAQALQVVSHAALVAMACEEYETSSDAPANTLACSEYGGCWQRGRHCFETRRWGRIVALAEGK